MSPDQDEQSGSQMGESGDPRTFGSDGNSESSELQNGSQSGGGEPPVSDVEPDAWREDSRDFVSCHIGSEKPVGGEDLEPLFAASTIQEAIREVEEEIEYGLYSPVEAVTVFIDRIDEVFDPE